MKCLKCRLDTVETGIYGLHFACYRDWFQLKSTDLPEFRDIDPRKSHSSSSAGDLLKREEGAFYHGKYRKYSARIGNTKYILKVQEDGFPDLPETEYVCNQIASLLKLEVPPYYLIRWKDKDEDRNSVEKPNLTFVTRNFMQDYTGTLNHLYKFLPKGPENYNCKNIVKAVFKQTGRLADVEAFVKICLFDALIGNNDRHGRNLGIIDIGKKKFLSPMYDNPSWFAVEKEDFLGADINPSGAVWTSSSKRPKMRDYIQEFERLDLKKSCVKFVERALREVDKIRSVVQVSGISEKRKSAFLVFLNKKLKELTDLV